MASAVIVFRGWPGSGFTDRIDNLFVEDTPPAAVEPPSTPAVAATAGAAARAVALTPAGPTFGTPGLALGNGGGAVRGRTVRLPNGSVVSTGPSGPGAVTPSVPGVPGTGKVLPSLPPSGGTGPVQNSVAETVQQTGSSVGGTVRQTTGTVGGAVGGPAGGAVTQTGDAAGGAVDGVTSGVGDALHGTQ